MPWWIEVVVASAAIPLAVAWHNNRGWTIRHALAWAAFAWLGWLAFAHWPGPETAYASLSLTGAAGVAVLGARRPGVVAWNFVVASLLIVLWLGWAEGLLSGAGLQLSTLRLVFVSGLLATTLLNYLTTISFPATLLLGVCCGITLMSLGNRSTEWPTSHTVLVACSCWLDWLLRKLLPWVPQRSNFDRIWRDFRNRYGAVWSERTREQFNAAARNKQWPVYLGWYGLRGEIDAALEMDCIAAIQSLIRRFHIES